MNILTCAIVIETMSTIELRLHTAPKVPLEAELVSPDRLADMDHEAICALPIYHGKRPMRLDQFFEVTGERSDLIEMHGDLHRVRWLGRGMTRGKLTVHGAVGMHLGAYMRGGEIEVHGDASDWIGAEMKNGTIRVHGNGGGQIGAGYRGSLAGMKNGTIIVDGDAGLEVGLRMRRGMIVIGGRARDFVGLQMKGGTIVLMGGAEIRTGAWMVRGTIISLAPLQMLPTFSRACECEPIVMTLLARHLASVGINLPEPGSSGTYEMFGGDGAVPGKGEIFVWKPAL